MNTALTSWSSVVTELGEKLGGEVMCKLSLHAFVTGRLCDQSLLHRSSLLPNAFQATEVPSLTPPATTLLI